MLRYCLVLLLLSPMPALAQDDKGVPDNVQKAKDLVTGQLRKLEGGGEANLLWKDEPAVRAMFPKQVFIAARFRIYPVARIIPEGFKPSNLFVVAGDKATHIKDSEALLLQGFQARGRMADTEEKARVALAAWLHLTQEFHQDGFYKFEVLEKEFTVAGDNAKRTVHGRAIVTAGGNGEISATLVFKDGTPASVEENVKLVEGPRPICQATKLLDVDPIVRRMAEKDLLCMGLAAREYLMEQREKAGPELRQAIDRLWGRMAINGW